jgi:hypothetical protein
VEEVSKCRKADHISNFAFVPVVTERCWFDFVSGHCTKDYPLTNTDAPACHLDSLTTKVSIKQP